MKNKSLNKSNILTILTTLTLLLVMVGCEDAFEFELPEANSQLDTELPTADFAAAQDVTDFRVYQFQNLSTESTRFSWEFSDGGTSSDENPLYTFEGGEGTYSVTLNTADENGETATITKEIVVVQPPEPAAFEPPILEGSFEDGALEGGEGDGRDSWRNSALGGVIQITNDPVLDGDQASKYPAEGDRIAYQELVVTPNADYRFTFYYTIKNSTTGSITFDVLAGGGYSSVTGAEILGTFTGTDQDDPGTYVEANLQFNSGANDLISIYIHNEGEEARLDLITIKAIE